jgi:hypothetical protein
MGRHIFASKIYPMGKGVGTPINNFVKTTNTADA